MYVCMYVCRYIYIYIYIEREREREIWAKVKRQDLNFEANQALPVWGSGPNKAGDDAG